MCVKKKKKNVKKKKKKKKGPMADLVDEEQVWGPGW